MICCVSRAKLHIWTRKIDESWGFRVFFLIFLFSEFGMVLRCSDSQNRLRGLISCLGLVSNRPDMKYQAYSNFRVHMVFMCRFSKSKSSSAIASWDLGPGPDCSFYIVVSMSEAGSQFKLSAAEHEPKHCQKCQILVTKRGLGAQGGFGKLAAQRHRITL